MYEVNDEVYEKIPSGAEEKRFVEESADWFFAFTGTSSIERIVFKSAMLMTALLLQKTSRKSIFFNAEKTLEEW